MRTCPVAGRIHRTSRELAAELARLDVQLASLRAIEARFSAAFMSPVPEPVGAAWNAVNDAIDALDIERRQVEANPRPMHASAAGTWALIQQNID